MKQFEKKLSNAFQASGIASHESRAYILLQQKIAGQAVDEPIEKRTRAVISPFHMKYRVVATLAVFCIAFFGIRVWNINTVNTESNSFSFYSAEALEYEKALASGEDDDVLQVYGTIDQTSAVVAELLS
jgi:hypothetical protein